MIKLKSELVVQIKNKRNRWEMTKWESLEEARKVYKTEIYRLIKIHKSYEVVKS